MTTAVAKVRRNWILIVVLHIVVIMTVRWAGNAAADSWSDALVTRLDDAGAGTNSLMVDYERRHLEALRSFSFAAGVPEALANDDIASVERLLTPVDANLAIPMVDILDENGRVVFAFRAEGRPAPIYRSRSDVGIVSRSLTGVRDDLGERFSTLLVTDEGPLLATAGPVRMGDDIVGAVLVMTPIEDVLAASAANNGALVTIYTAAGGYPLATTSPVRPRNLPQEFNRLIPTASLPMASSYDLDGGEARERLGELVIRHQAVAWLGVAEEDRSGAVRTRVMTVALLGVLAVIALTLLVSTMWRRSGPVHRPRKPASREREADDPIGELPIAVPEPVAAHQGGRQRW